MEDLQQTLERLSSMRLLCGLLKDRTTKARIIWGTDAYAHLGDAYACDREIEPKLLLKQCVLQTRAQKAKQAQTERTRRHAEVFTPLWICKKMNDHLDEVWFGRTDAFDGERVEFQDRSWQRYVDSRRLEITCGEAPFLVSRYDAASGETIPQKKRIGLLDRKLRVVNENAADEAEWFQWAERAFMSIYGYEFQGDNLLIARINLLLTFEEAVRARWQRQPTARECGRIVRVIAYNLWQMDGLTGCLPYSRAEEACEQLTMDMFLDMPPCAKPTEKKRTQPLCTIYDWRSEHKHVFSKVREGRHKMKFDFIIGNPPYQEEVASNNRQTPIYNYFMDEAYKIADVVEMITPARFLFDAGQTPKAWNTKMLSDEHLKVLYFESNSERCFSNVDIKGGVAITLRNAKIDYGAIGTFMSEPLMNTILHKVKSLISYTMTDIAYPKSYYGLTSLLYEELPSLRGRLTANNEAIIDASIFTKMPEAFINDTQDDTIAVLGREGNSRVCKHIASRYIKKVAGIDKYKVFVTGANGRGEFGEILSNPFVAPPFSIGTQTYMTFGFFDTENEANGCLKYIKSKFARCLLSVLKVTQNNPKDNWKCIPLQDFTPTSDIDWSLSIPEIDRQLYAKYGLTDEEIEFIETHVKEMT